MAFNTNLSLEAQNYNMQGLSAANQAVNYSLLNNTTVAAADTNAGIVAAIQAAAAATPYTTSYELRQGGLIDRICRAITRNIGVFTDAAILGLTTTAGLIALATAADPRLPSDYTGTSPSE
jgi:hypothetical protein